MTSHANGYGHEPIDLDFRLKRVESQTEEHADQLDGLRVDMAVVRAKLEAAEEADDERHHETMRLLQGFVDEQRAANKARSKRLDRCLGVVENAASRVTEPRVLLVLAVAVLAGTLTGSGLAVRVYDWLTIGPAGVSAE